MSRTPSTASSARSTAQVPRRLSLEMGQPVTQAMAVQRRPPGSMNPKVSQSTPLATS